MLSAARRTRHGACIAALAGLLAGAAHATDAPLWELGAGIGAVGFSDYRGADTSSVYPVPVPYVVYRGRYLQADRDGVRGILFKQPRAELHVSVNATTPVDSDGSGARAGMPDLDPALEIGPSLNVLLWKPADGRFKLDLRLPVRGALTASTDPQWIGWQALPQLNLDVRTAAQWNFGVLAGPIFADREYTDYFYGVAPRYATGTRRAYEARSGYVGTHLVLSTSKRFDNMWFGAFARYDRLDGAVFESSPLVKQRGAWMAGFGFAWIFARSTVLVPLPD